MDPLLTPLLISAASNLPSMILGGSQLFKSGKMHPVRPEYEIPEAEKQALQLAKNMGAQTRLPGQEAIEGQLDETTANTLATIERMGYGGASDINAASRAYGNQQDKETQLGIAAAGNRQQNLRNLQGALSHYATYEDKKWNLNELQPYEQDSRAKAALYEGGMTNLTGGLKDIAGGLSNVMLADYFGKQQDSNFNNWMKMMGKTTTSQPAPQIPVQIGTVLPTSGQDNTQLQIGPEAGFTDNGGGFNWANGFSMQPETTQNRITPDREQIYYKSLFSNPNANIVI